MFLMTCRTGAVLHHVGLVECVRPPILFKVAGLTFSVDRLERDAVMKTFAQHCVESRWRQRASADEGLVVTLRAIVGKPSMTTRNLSGIKKCFATAHLKEHNTDDSANNGEAADQKTRTPPWVLFLVIAEIGFVALGNLFLRSARRGHGRCSVVKERHEGMPPGKHEKQKRERHVHKQPAVQPMMQPCLKIEHAALVAPRLDFFNPNPIRFRDSKFHKTKCVVRIAAIAEAKFVAAFRAEIREHLPLEKLNQGGFRFRLSCRRS